MVGIPAEIRTEYRSKALPVKPISSANPFQSTALFHSIAHGINFKRPVREITLQIVQHSVHTELDIHLLSSFCRIDIGIIMAFNTTLIALYTRHTGVLTANKISRYTLQNRLLGC
jgi:hypothetical protein